MINNKEFHRLMDLPKHFLEESIQLPMPGDRSKPYTVYSNSTRDIFLLDTDRSSRITLNRSKIQERYLNEPELLVRLEIDSKPHINPDGHKLSRNHIHIYREGYGLSWAYDIIDLKQDLFNNITSFSNIFYDFCKYCNIDLSKTYIQEVI